MQVAVASERRFGGLRRLYGVSGAQRLLDAHAVVVGVGGVGSWAAEALARSGIGHITLVDMDHVSESNTNRQIHALDPCYGMAKVDAMRQRILAINPHACVDALDDFVTPDNWPALLAPCRQAGQPIAVLDACDQMAAKHALAAWALREQVPFVTVGAAGGKRLAHRVEVDDLAVTTHDPLLASLRYRLRKAGVAPRQGRMGVTCVFSREAVSLPTPGCDLGHPADGGTAQGMDGSLNCHGYGSSVAVTATFGMCAAGRLLEWLSASK
jgi:tRNA A37 threonylcarbamoyladenosine dehydratase